MDEKIKALVEGFFKKAGLEGFLHGIGLESYVRVGLGVFSPREYKMDHRLLTRANRRDELFARLKEIIDDYKNSIESR